jgi:hypothetical protein
MTSRKLAVVSFLAFVTFLAACSSSTHSASVQPPSGTSSTAPPHATTPGSGSDIVGNWTGTWQRTKPVPGQGAVTLTLQTTSTGIKGSVSWSGSACLAQADVEGTLNGNSIAYHTVGGTTTATFTGTVNGSSMSGTANVTCAAGTGVGNWQVTKQ